jgi:hypothetical protein
MLKLVTYIDTTAISRVKAGIAASAVIFRADHKDKVCY